MGKDDLILLNWWPSPFGAKVKIALEEKGLNYENREEDLFNKSPLLLELNPIYKRVPVLIHNGKPLCESNIIVQYIDEVWNDKAPVLLPSDPYQRAQARFWADYSDKLRDVGAKILFHKSKDEAEEGSKEYVGMLKLIEGELGDKPYFGGESFGYLDISIIGNYMLFYAYETFANFSIEAECPKLMVWVKRCLERKSVAKTFGDPKVVYQIALEWRKAFGLE